MLKICMKLFMNVLTLEQAKEVADFYAIDLKDEKKTTRLEIMNYELTRLKDLKKELQISVDKALSHTLNMSLKEDLQHPQVYT